MHQLLAEVRSCQLEGTAEAFTLPRSMGIHVPRLREPNRGQVLGIARSRRAWAQVHQKAQPGEHVIVTGARAGLEL